MRRFRKLAHTLWHCHYHMVWTPQYRFRILSGHVSEEVRRCIRAFREPLQGEVVELHIQVDHVHLIIMVPPKTAVSTFVGTVKGRSAMRVFNTFRHVKQKPYWGNHCWSRGSCVDTRGLDAEKIRLDVQDQETRDRQAEQLDLPV